MDNIFIILVEPQMGENIGAAARVMANFGAHNLRIVNPRDGWPNTKAIHMAKSGAFLLEKASIYPTLQDAISDLQLVIATSAYSRDLQKHELKISELSQLRRRGRVGVVFGRESTGLTNQEIGYADYLLSIPTVYEHSSLNLAQAVAIVSYELSQIEPQEVAIELAKKEELQHFFASLEGYLDEGGFFKVLEKRLGMVQNIRNIFLKAQLTEQEVKTLQGIIRNLAGKI